jgi:flagellar hook assembly protein FlgD
LVGEENVEIIIYSISNEVLFRTTNKYQAWNCKLPNGQDAPEGSYLVKVIYQFKGKSKETTVRKLTIIK